MRKRLGMVLLLAAAAACGSDGPSIAVLSCHMSPSAEPGDAISAVDPDGPVARGAFISFDRPASTSNREMVVSSRVIGLPGETISFANGKVLVDGDASVDHWATSEPTEGSRSVTLKDNEYYVLADNRTIAQDSRVYGPVPYTSIRLVAELEAAGLGATSDDC